LNLIPFGGYVKIFGETIDEDALNPEAKDSFLNKSPLTQASVLVSGVLFNVLFAWLLISISLMAGFPSIVTEGNRHEIKESFVVVTSLFEDSPATEARLRSGDKILGVSNGENFLGIDTVTVESVQEMISSSPSSVTLSISRGDVLLDISVIPKSGVIDDNTRAIGISMDRVGKLRLPFFSAIGRGFLMTGQMIRDISIGLVTLISDMFVGQASLNNVAGPIGIVGLINDASSFGFYYLLSFTAFISINLAILNILPLPALDGGRLLILIVETIAGRRIRSSIVNAINGIGFALLILLMIIITINDILKLF